MTTHTGGDALYAMLEGPEFSPLTAEDTTRISSELAAAVASNDEATCRRLREELVKRHLRLVVSLSRGYRSKLDPEEAFAVGSLALVEAMERWQPYPGGMSAYQWAKRWVTTALNKATDAARTIRIPEQVAYRAAINTKLVAERQYAIGRELSEKEIAELTGGGLRLQDLPIASASLDASASEYAGTGGENTLEEVIADSSVTAEDMVERDDLYSRLRAALSILTEEERMVIRHRFGIDGAEGMTLIELGKKMGTSGEAPRRLEASALAKLHHPANPYAIGDAL